MPRFVTVETEVRIAHAANLTFCCPEDDSPPTQAPGRSRPHRRAGDSGDIAGCGPDSIGRLYERSGCPYLDVGAGDTAVHRFRNWTRRLCAGVDAGPYRPQATTNSLQISVALPASQIISILQQMPAVVVELKSLMAD